MLKAASFLTPLEEKPIASKIARELTAEQLRAIWPLVLFFVGRGNCGKSTLFRLIFEHCANPDDIIMIDVDTSNAKISRRYGGRVIVPPDDLASQDFDDWLWGVITELAAQRRPIMIDFLGNDSLFVKMIRRYDAREILEDLQVRAVLVHVMGANEDDLDMMRILEEEGRFTPPDTVIAINDRAIQGREQDVFDEFIKHDLIEHALQRGAEIIQMPKCRPLPLLDAYAGTYAQTRERIPIDGPPHGLLTHQMQDMRRFLDHMDRELMKIADRRP